MTRILFLLFASLGLTAQTITGFSPDAAKKQAEIETRYKALPQQANEEKLHSWLTAEPHPAGSERNNQLAFDIEKMWKEQGLEDVKVHRYDVLISNPKETSLEMLTPVKYKAGLREEGYDVDPDTKNPNVKSAYTSLSISGEVIAPIVYAHSGNPEDYALLKKNGIDVKGKVVLVRYSNPYSYRGFKALTAQKMGAAAILIYSDPMEDGYGKGKVFPDGPWGPESHIQRGAITYDFMVAGDPLSPGFASVPGAKLIDPKDAVSLPHIMAMPLSWKDAKPLLENMGGPLAPKSWQGALPIEYRLGGKGTVHLKIDMDTGIKPIYVVEGRIRGAEFPDEWVLFGNHRDAWEFGGVDPSSGTASLLEMTRSFGELLKQGVRPRRTLVFCSWDAEEIGLTGSTEWGEQFADELQKKLIAYLNVDSSTSGPKFAPQAIASLAPMVVEMSKTIDDPSGKSLYEAWKATENKKRQEEAKAKGKPAKPVTDDELVDTRIGSGSDHTVFLNHLGIPVMNLSFDGPYGVYHSMYDNHYWMSHFGDPGFKYHTAMSQLWGVIGLRLANAEVLPFDFEFYAKEIKKWVKELESKDGVEENLNLADLKKAVNKLEQSARSRQESARRLIADKNDPREQQHFNQRANEVERSFRYYKGIPGRPWFLHLLYAARFTYAHLELPGLTEAIEKKDWKEARRQRDILTNKFLNTTCILSPCFMEN